MRDDLYPDLWVRPGNWKRFICNWWGHENIGTRDLLYGTPEVMCLRCRGSATRRPAVSGVAGNPDKDGGE